MATYIQGLTDYIPQIQPFKPDLNLYAKVLQMKQDKYDAAKREIGTLYGSLLYSPLTRQDNIQRRDEFFKTIEQQIKKISSMDLSLAQNQDAAMKIFDPIINDKKISHDWSFTKNAMNEMERGENFRYCTDPKKCGGAYSPESMTYLNMKLEEYANADAGAAMGMNISDVKFVPFNNLQKDALDWAKATGLLVEQADFMGGYIVKRQNGETIKVPLTELFLSTFGNDPKYKEHYKQLAYINKRNWINERLSEYNDDPYQAETAYYNDVITKTVKSLEEDIKLYEQTHGQISVRSKAMQNRLKNDGVVANDDGDIGAILEAQEDEAISEGAMGYYRDLQQRISNLSVNRDNLSAFGSQIESIVGDGFMKMDLAQATENLANTFNNVTDIRENQFSLNAQTHQHRIDEMKLKFNLDDQAAINAALYEISKETALKFLEGGMPTDNEGNPVEPSDGNILKGLDLYTTTQEKATGYGKTVANNQKQYNATVIQSLHAIANNDQLDSDTRQLARNELSNMLGPFYDKNNNLFVDANGKTKVSDYSQLNLDAKNQTQIYKNAQIIMKRNKATILQSIVNTTSTLQEETDQMSLFMLASYENMTKNNKLIRDAAASVKDVKDKILFNGLFIESADGSLNVITNEDEYVKKMMATRFVNSKGETISMSPETKEKKLRRAFQENFELYKEFHNNGPEYGITGIQAPNGNGLGTGIDGYASVQGRTWSSQYGSPNSFANKGFISYMKDVERNPASAKALIGTGHTADDYDVDADRAARIIFNMYRQDLMSGKYATDGTKEKAPMASVTYFDAAAESSGKVSLSLTNINPEWLRSLATDDKKKMIGSTSIEDIIDKGVTMYLDKGVAQNIITKNFMEKPGDAYINSGKTWSMSRPHGGNISISKSNNRIMVNGYLIGYDNQGNQRKIPVTHPMDGDMISGAALIQNYTNVLNDQQTANVDYLKNGNLPRIYDQETLMQELRKRMSPGGQLATTRMDYFRSLIGK